MKAVPSDMYYHEADRKALAALKAIPGLGLIMKKYMEIFSETTSECLNMAMKIRLGPNQLPEIYNLLPPICETLGIAEPQFYLEMNPYPQAYTDGDSKTFVTITSGLLDMMTQEELSAVIAHECGHIACHHVLYRSLGFAILSAGSSFLGGLGHLITLPLKLAFASWIRCSELSADRAAAVYMKGSEHVENVMLRLSSGKKDLLKNINKELYMKQAEAYQNMLNDKWNKAMQYFATMWFSHPLSSVRTSEINKWCKSDEFSKIIKFMEDESTDVAIVKANTAFCPKCGTAVSNDDKFCKICGTAL